MQHYAWPPIVVTVKWLRHPFNPRTKSVSRFQRSGIIVIPGERWWVLCFLVYSAPAAGVAISFVPDNPRRGTLNIPLLGNRVIKPQSRFQRSGASIVSGEWWWVLCFSFSSFSKKWEKGELDIPTWDGRELRKEKRKSYRYPPRGGRRTKKRKKTWGRRRRNCSPLSFNCTLFF